MVTNIIIKLMLLQNTARTIGAIFELMAVRRMRLYFIANGV